jgi:2-polyprenyl-3-methyl-5-hydroxy-6-metoxy-1,4-benzoquinol methylase
VEKLHLKQIFDRYVETSFDGPNPSKDKIDQLYANYRRFFPASNSARTLDIGVGRGEMLICMRNLGYDYYGIDISPSTIEVCRRNNLSCEVVANTASWLRNHEGCFELVTCLDVLEHVPREEVIALLVAIRAGLTASGRLILQVPNLQSPFGYLHHFNDFTHVNGFVEHSLQQVLLAAGFTSINFYGFEERVDPQLKAKIALIARPVYWQLIRFLRRLNGNPNPQILTPVFFAVALS